MAEHAKDKHATDDAHRAPHAERHTAQDEPAPAHGRQQAPDEEHDAYFISSSAARLENRTRVLKHGDSFVVLDRAGNVEGQGLNEYGLFHQDTRYLSQLAVRISVPGRKPTPLMLLSSAVKDDSATLIVHLTNPAMPQAGHHAIEHGTLHVLRSQTLWRSTLCDKLSLHNYSEKPIAFTLHAAFGGDFADIFQVRGTPRKQHGKLHPPRIDKDALLLSYEGLDDRLRRTRIHFDSAPASLSASEAAYEIELAPHEAVSVQWTVSCQSQPALDQAAVAAHAEATARPPSYDDATQQVLQELQASRERQPGLCTSNAQFNEWIGRSLDDLRMLTTETPKGPYPYAGVPWYSTPFGRDGIITALQMLWFDPSVARGVLQYLAWTQADHESAEQDAQPGKILHETRSGEMAATGEVPFGRYYGSIDSTPLFLMLAGAYHERTGDTETIGVLWPNIERALAWIDQYGDRDGDGFVEYARETSRGLANQGWKDSYDAVFHADGRLADAPIALCEVQGYVYDAKRACARMAHALGDEARAQALQQQAATLRERFEQAFWCEELGTYAIALDGHKQPCRVRTSNAGQCLYTGIPSLERARIVAQTLMSDAGFSGWGVRTVASTEVRYNPMSYHDGSVWPHDNSIVAAGLGRYGLREPAARILGGLFDASLHFDLHRLPELFCGFSQRDGENPTLYPQACSPQAWASGALLLCLQACLGLEVHGRTGIVCFRNPVVPPFLGQLRINGLRLPQGAMDIEITRHQQDVSVRLTRREGRVQLQVQM
jgi:glycogen debranching enzyme